MSTQHSTIRPAIFPDDQETVSRLFLAYAQSLPISLDFQNFEHELAGLPGKYAIKNGGAVFLASRTLTVLDNDGNAWPEAENPPQREQVIGCVALRPFAPPEKCELKRLYLTPEARGVGLAKGLMEVVIRKARQLGYDEILLDTLNSMTAAMNLYEKYGFEQIESYYESVDNAVFYRLKL